MLKKWLPIGLLLLTSCNADNKEETNEAKTMDMTSEMNDPHSFSVPGESVTTHLKWDAVVDFDSRTISGTATYSLKNSTDAKKVILDTKNLTIKSVTDGDDNALTFNVGATVEHLGEPLTIDITPETESIKIEYNTSPEAEALQWLSSTQTADETAPFLFTQSQAILARSWIPVQDSPGIRFTYEANVTVPEGLLALMSAENPTAKNDSGSYSFKMEQRIPAYLLALSVGDIAYESLGPRTGVYAEPSVVKAAAYEFGELENMVKAAEELYGPYQWDIYDIIVLPPSFPFGGMENPRLTFATPTILAGDRSLTSLVAHELAHSWSGNLVTNANWNDFWLNEGFTVYFEQRIMEKLYGRNYSEMLASLSSADLKEEIQEMIASGKGADSHLKLDLEGRNPDDGLTTIAYDKGYLFLRSLEEQVGREKFDAFLRSYFTDNAFKSMTTEMFLERLKAQLFDKNGLEYDSSNIQAWVYGPGLPDNAPQPVSDKFETVEKSWAQLAGGAALSSLAVKEWSSHEWLHFVRNIPEDYTAEDMTKLDAAFGFTSIGNSEVLTEWLVQSIKHNYTAANDRLKSFLVKTGRRKFLIPLYEELIKTESGKQLAREIYVEARPNYHFVSTNSIDALLNE